MDEVANTLLILLTLGVMLTGLASLIVPVLPGLAVIWLAALGYGVLAGFGKWGPWLFGLITVLLFAGLVTDNLLMAAGARKGGASWWSIAAASALALIGLLLLPPVGGLIGGLLGVLLVEYYRARDWRQAWRATKGMAAGCGGAVLARMVLGTVMIGAWGVWAWAG